MELIRVTKENWQEETLCCAPSTTYAGVYHKKMWLKQAFKDGLIFLRTASPTQAFIEFMPAEHSWLPLDASGYFVILCFRVRDPNKHQGLGALLLEACLKEAKAQHAKGVIVISTKEKKPFLSDAEYLKHSGFHVVDTALDTVELLCYSLEQTPSSARFKACAKSGTIAEQGMVIYYSPQCVFTEPYLDLLQHAFKRQKMLLGVYRYRTKEEAQNAPCPFTTFSVFINGVFCTHEILREKKAQQLANTHHI